MGEKELSALGKEEFKIFHEVMNLITSFFPRSKSASLASSSVSFPWLDVLVASQQCAPRIFLILFEKPAAVSKEVFDKFTKVADNKRKTSSALPTWG